MNFLLDTADYYDAEIGKNLVLKFGMIVCKSKEATRKAA